MFSFSSKQNNTFLFSPIFRDVPNVGMYPDYVFMNWDNREVILYDLEDFNDPRYDQLHYNVVTGVRFSIEGNIGMVYLKVLSTY